MAIKVLLLSVLLWAAGAGAATWLPELGDEVTALLPGGEPMEFVWIPPGSFVMGSTPGEASERRALGLWENSFGNEQPALEQTIGEGFYLGKYEITQRQCTAAMGTRPWGGYVSGHHNAAAVCLSWDAVQAFVAQLNAALGDSVYRLPTEAEWEYAARAGSVAPWFFGSDFAMLGDYAWAKGARSPLPVGPLRYLRQCLVVGKGGDVALRDGGLHRTGAAFGRGCAGNARGGFQQQSVYSLGSARHGRAERALFIIYLPGPDWCG